MAANPSVRTAILRSLKELGPQTCSELAAELGNTVSSISASISRDRKRNGTLNFRVSGWQGQAPGIKGAIAPIYAVGNKRPDKTKTDTNRHEERKAKRRENYARRNAMHLVAARRGSEGTVRAGFFDALVPGGLKLNGYTALELEILTRNMNAPAKAKAELDAIYSTRSLGSIKKKQAILRKQALSEQA